MYALGSRVFPSVLFLHVLFAVAISLAGEPTIQAFVECRLVFVFVVYVTFHLFLGGKSGGLELASLFCAFVRPHVPLLSCFVRSHCRGKTLPQFGSGQGKWRAGPFSG